MLCARCSVDKEPTDFYAKSKTCKTCRCAMVRANRLARLEQYREYEKSRANLPHRVRAREEYARTERGRAAGGRAKKRWDADHPDRRSASYAANNAVRDGRLKKLPCIVCGDTRSHGHHPDYSRPLEVVWLCPLHHKQAHAASVPYRQLEAGATPAGRPAERQQP